MSQESMGEATDQLVEAKKRNEAVAETSVYTDEARPLDETRPLASSRALSPKLKRLIIPILIFVAFQVVAMILGRILRNRYLGQEVGEDEVNAVGVTGAAQEKITTQAFKGGYLRAVMGAVELDLSQAAIETPPATIEATVIMGGAEIKVPQDWVVTTEARSIMGAVEDVRGQEKASEGTTPDLVITGKVIMGGLTVNC
jgi:hypothetical protein